MLKIWSKLYGFDISIFWQQTLLLFPHVSPCKWIWMRVLLNGKTGYHNYPCWSFQGFRVGPFPMVWVKPVILKGPSTSPKHQGFCCCNNLFEKCLFDGEWALNRSFTPSASAHQSFCTLYPIQPNRSHLIPKSSGCVFTWGNPLMCANNNLHREREKGRKKKITPIYSPWYMVQPPPFSYHFHWARILKSTQPWLSHVLNPLRSLARSSFQLF